MKDYGPDWRLQRKSSVLFAVVAIALGVLIFWFIMHLMFPTVGQSPPIE